MTGIATLNFGTAAQRNTDVSAAVTGVSGIQSGSYIEAYLQGDSTADNDADSHLIASELVNLAVGAIVPGVGFTIYGFSEGGVTGNFHVRWAAV